MFLKIALKTILLFLINLLLIFNKPIIAQSYLDSDSISVGMIEELTIGNEPSKPIEYSFGQPWDIAVDSRQNIFVADQGGMEIKIFDKEGEFIQKVGRRGKGPGEFISLRMIHLTEKDELLIVDEMGFKITKFDAEGEILDTYNFSRENRDILFFNQIIDLPENYLVFSYKFGSSFDEDEMFFIWDESFDDKLGSFGSFNQLGFEEGFSKNMAAAGVGSMFLLDEETLLFAPTLYKGKLFKYENLNNEWKFSEEVKGYNVPDPPHENYSSNSRVKDAMEIYGPSGKMLGNIYVSGSGLFRMNNGYVVHFSMTKIQEGSDSGKWQFGVELFDNELTYLGYFPLRTHNEIFPPMFPAVKSMDNEGNFYLIGEDGYLIMQRFSLEIEGL